jgi:hypothetical protein
MTENYSVKINRHDGALEIAGDKEWVDQKLAQLADVFTMPLSDSATDSDRDAAADERKKSSRSRRKTKAATNGETKPARRRSSGSTRVKGLDLAPKGKQSFDEFVGEKQPKSQHDKSAACVYYLSEIAEITPVTSDHVYTCYRDQGWDMPPDMATSLFLTASKKGSLDTSNLDDITIEPRGVNHIERGLPTKKER